MIDFIGIDLISFHDLPVKNIKFSSEDTFELALEVTPYNEETSTYDLIKICFADFQHLNIGKLEIDKDSSLEITSFDYHIQNDLLFGKMVLLLGHSKPSLVIDFAFKRVEVN